MVVDHVEKNIFKPICDVVTINCDMIGERASCKFWTKMGYERIPSGMRSTATMKKEL